MPYCPKCRAEIDEDWDYCRECGYELRRRGGGGCFIATASYGTPFAKEIDVLRQWRDKSLMSNLFGKIFVKFYYLMSPPLANFISKSESLKKAVRLCLNPIVKHLKSK